MDLRFCAMAAADKAAGLPLLTVGKPAPSMLFFSFVTFKLILDWSPTKGGVGAGAATEAGVGAGELNLSASAEAFLSASASRSARLKCVLMFGSDACFTSFGMRGMFGDKSSGSSDMLLINAFVDGVIANAAGRGLDDKDITGDDGVGDAMGEGCLLTADPELVSGFVDRMLSGC